MSGVFIGSTSADLVPGAQQLTRPDFENEPHLGHVTVVTIIGVKPELLPTVAIGARTISSRPGKGRRVT